MDIKKEIAGDDIIIEDEKTSEVNFHHTADFGSAAPKEIIEDTVSIVSHTDNIVLIDDSQAWKPMNFDSNIPDALIGSVKTKVVSKPSIKEEKDVTANETPKIEETIIVNKEEDSKDKEKNTDEARPIINVSFFSDALSIVSDNSSNETIKKADTSDIITESSIPSIENDRKESVGNSNVNKFINTWQSWLKIDRSEEIVKTKEVQKHKAIEQFIENQPKISQLKDEVNFIVKEKKEDISHLMTETFANLYLEQKLYTKAINAFEILIKKHPEKSDYFQSRITDIKDMRKP